MEDSRKKSTPRVEEIDPNEGVIVNEEEKKKKDYLLDEISQVLNEIGEVLNEINRVLKDKTYVPEKERALNEMGGVLDERKYILNKLDYLLEEIGSALHLKNNNYKRRRVFEGTTNAQVNSKSCAP